MRRLIFVCTWFGPDTIGGAEHLCRRLAEELRRLGRPVEVYSTTARGFLSPWFEPHYPVGTQLWGDLPVRHFPVARWSDVPFFSERLDLLQGLSALPEAEVAHLVEMPQSDALYRALAEDDEALFFFFIYSHNLSFWGARMAPERSFLVPCLHDEPYAFHQATRLLMRQVRGCFFLSEPERWLALDLYGLDPRRTWLLGAGVDPAPPGDAERFRAQRGLRDPFLLYVGRRDSSKNVPLLVEHFCAYKGRYPGALKLVLIGPGSVDIPAAWAGEVLDLGVVSEQEKQDAYAAATLLCQPSPIESFSIVLLEGWQQGTPALVNADCAVTVYHCLQSNGGLYYRDAREFAAAVNYLLARPALRERMGQAGRSYAAEGFTWPAVARRFLAALEEMGGGAL